MYRCRQQITQNAPASALRQLCVCSTRKKAERKGGAYIKHCMTAFMKQVSPRFLKPLSGASGFSEGTIRLRCSRFCCLDDRMLERLWRGCFGGTLKLFPSRTTAKTLRIVYTERSTSPTTSKTQTHSPSPPSAKYNSSIYKNNSSIYKNNSSIYTHGEQNYHNNYLHVKFALKTRYS